MGNPTPHNHTGHAPLPLTGYLLVLLAPTESDPPHLAAHVKTKLGFEASRLGEECGTLAPRPGPGPGADLAGTWVWDKLLLLIGHGGRNRVSEGGGAPSSSLLRWYLDRIRRPGAHETIEENLAQGCLSSLGLGGSKSLRGAAPPWLHHGYRLVGNRKEWNFTNVHVALLCLVGLVDRDRVVLVESRSSQGQGRP